MSWITMDTKLGRHPKMAELPNDTARYGWVLTLLEAKEQRHPGTFASANHFRHVMGKYGRFLDAYVKAGLIDKDEDGTIHVHDWQRHQWSVSKQKQRGQDEDIGGTSEGQKEDASRAVPVRVPVGVVSSTEKEDRAGAEVDAVVAFHQRTGEVPGPKIRSWLDELAEAHGEARLSAMIADTPSAGLKVPDYLRSVRDRLRLQDHAADRAEKHAEQKRVEEKRAPLKALPPAADISEADAKAQAAAYMARARS